MKGEMIQEKSDKIGYCPIGEAVVKTAGNLRTKFVIHEKTCKFFEKFL